MLTELPELLWPSLSDLGFVPVTACGEKVLSTLMAGPLNIKLIGFTHPPEPVASLDISVNCHPGPVLVLSLSCSALPLLLKSCQAWCG